MEKTTTTQTARFTLRSVSNRNIHKKVIPSRGEPIYDLDTRELLIGDGVTPIARLKPIRNIVEAEDGRLYTVIIDSNGIPVQTIPVQAPVQCPDGTLLVQLCTDVRLRMPLN